MTRVARIEHLDRAALKAPVRMDNGFLKVEGRIARVGIQEYYDSDGSLRRELRLPEDVFDAESLASFHQVPVTNTHPPGMLTAQNARDYSVGSVGENVRRDGDYVVAPLMITDAQAIRDAEEGRSQLSNGYSCEMDYTKDPALTAQWGQYDSIQRKIRGNHCALVDAARAGPEARIRLDAGGAVAGTRFCTSDGSQVGSTKLHAQKGTNEMAHKVKIDGLEFEAADANAQSIVDRALAAAKKDAADALAKEKDRADKAEVAKADAEKALADIKVQVEAAKAKADAKAEEEENCDECDGKGKMDEKPCPRCDGKGKFKPFGKADARAELKASIARRIERGARDLAKLMDEARVHLGANENLDGGEIAIRSAVIKKLLPKVVLDGKSDAEVRAYYDAATSGTTRETPTSKILRAVNDADPAPVKVEDGAPSRTPTEAYDRMVERNKKALVKK